MNLSMNMYMRMMIPFIRLIRVMRIPIMMVGMMELKLMKKPTPQIHMITQNFLIPLTFHLDLSL